jgi:glycosyltransferase involved in cell wall biosynthesis
VEGLLAQTHANITVVVVNDGDPHPPWHSLAGINDRRLVRFDLANNYGPYLATAVVLNATTAPYFLIQDADDWSTPNRVQSLLHRLDRDGSDFAVSAQMHYSERPDRGRRFDLRWADVATSESGRSSYVVKRFLTPEFTLRVPHHGLFRTSSLRRIGGYYAGFRVSYDALLTNLILMTGRISHLPQPLYYRSLRAESLTRASNTGMKSRFRRETERAIGALYSRCYGPYVQYLAGRIDSAALMRAIRHAVAKSCSREHALQMASDAARLTAVLNRITMA